MNGNATPPGRIDEFDFAEGGADERLLAESIPSTPSRSRTPPAQHQSLASWLRSAVLSLPAPLQNAAFGAAAFARRNSRILVLAVVAVTVLVSVVKLREEVQDFYEDLEEERREWGGGYDSPTWAEGQRGEVETVHGDKIRPGDLLIHPDQKDTVRAMVLELMARFNRVSWTWMA